MDRLGFGLYQSTLFLIVVSVFSGALAASTKNPNEDKIRCFCKVPPNTLVSCPGDYVECQRKFGCLKAQTSQDHVIKSCASREETPRDDGCTHHEEDKKKAAVCVCRTELCNGQLSSLKPEARIPLQLFTSVSLTLAYTLKAVSIL